MKNKNCVFPVRFFLGKYINILSIIIMGFFAVGGSHAQPLPPRPTVTRAVDVFESYPERVAVTGRIALKTKNTPAAKRVVHYGLQVRVFTLRNDQSRPSPITSIDECDVFSSIVLRLETPNDEEIIFPQLNAGWLNLTDSLKEIDSGKYFFVFEKIGSDMEQFRLKKSDYDRYFDTGFKLFIDGDQNVSLEAVRTVYFARRDKLIQLRFDIDDKKNIVPCYTYQKLASDTTLDVQVSQLQGEQCDRTSLVN